MIPPLQKFNIRLLYCMPNILCDLLAYKDPVVRVKGEKKKKIENVIVLPNTTQPSYAATEADLVLDGNPERKKISRLKSLGHGGEKFD